jgi:hypothetical protein
MLVVALLAAAIVPGPGGEPFRQPSVAAGKNIAGVAFGAGSGIYFASTDGSKPVLVSSAGKLALGRHRGPRLAFSGSTAIISAITGDKPGREAGNLFVWRSRDGGKTWTAPARINDVPDSAREGLHGMAANGTTVAIAWLDLRTPGTKLYGVVSRDGGATWSKNTLVYESPAGTICQCCHPSVAVANDGTVMVMFRNALDGNRDMYLARLNGAKPVKLGAASWKLEACPMDGGSLAFDAVGRPFTAWRRESQVYAAGSDGKEELVGQGKDPAVAIGRNGPYIVWLQGPELKLRRPRREPETLDPAGAWPSLAALPDGQVVAAWESAGSIRLETLPE